MASPVASPAPATATAVAPTPIVAAVTTTTTTTTPTATPTATPTKPLSTSDASPATPEAAAAVATVAETVTTTPVAAAPTTPVPAAVSPVTRASYVAVAPAPVPAPTAVAAPSSSLPPGPCVLRKYYTCAATDSEPVQRCERDGCIKFIHRSCSMRVTEPFRDHNEPFQVVCGKRCFNAITKSRVLASIGGASAPLAASTMKHDASIAPSSATNNTTATPPATSLGWPAHSGERKKRSPWNSDGPSATVNSLSVLLAWLRDPKNYARWVNGGDETKFETKAALATQILALIKSKGIPTDRNRNDVFAKIYQLEKSFAEAAEWVAANAKTLDDANLAAGARKRCAFYHDLAPSMGIKHTKRGHYGDGSRKRSASAHANIAPAAGLHDSNNTAEPAAKRQLVPRSDNPDVHSTAADLAAAIEAHATSAATVVPDASATALATAYESSEALNAANLAAFFASSSISGTTKTPIDGAQLNVALLQAVAEKLQADAKSAAVAASTALLRARKMLRDEGVPQVEIDTALPLARSA